jgi:hypothetical protein
MQNLQPQRRVASSQLFDGGEYESIEAAGGARHEPRSDRHAVLVDVEQNIRAGLEQGY